MEERKNTFAEDECDPYIPKRMQNQRAVRFLVILCLRYMKRDQRYICKSVLPDTDSGNHQKPFFSYGFVEPGETWA
ncbi:hypothetical protein [Planococcus lenghuensis]|uniref:hypothetical protein n=1 Tax=Planococcus lenghuensis TaxID=2213202 RepID=UPI0012EC6A1B|nr:hypothetical protein [Planococcus lenghuensis]